MTNLVTLLAPYESLIGQKRYAYGTAGFRSKYTEEMHPLFIIVGILASLRSISLDGKCVGVMVTASHNEEQDNGVKIVDADGGMLSKEWELLAEEIVNLPYNTLLTRLETLIVEVTQSHPSLIPQVMLGMDTRSHSPLLVNYVEIGIRSIQQGKAWNLGEVITPIVHFCVLAYNESKPSSSPESVFHFSKEQYLSQYYET
jgi:phosphoacetylglucosamine mutase